MAGTATDRPPQDVLHDLIADLKAQRSTSDLGAFAEEAWGLYRVPCMRVLGALREAEQLVDSGLPRKERQAVKARIEQRLYVAVLLQLSIASRRRRAIETVLVALLAAVAAERLFVLFEHLVQGGSYHRHPSQEHLAATDSRRCQVLSGNRHACFQVPHRLAACSGVRV